MAETENRRYELIQALEEALKSVKETKEEEIEKRKTRYNLERGIGTEYIIPLVKNNFLHSN
jgi:hypothetical protein